MDEQTQQEIIYMGQQLDIVLGNDNDARKGAEEAIKKIKDGEPDKYAFYLKTIIIDPSVSDQIKSLACVILRRTLSSYEDQKPLWDAIKPETKEMLRGGFFDAMKSCQTKDIIHKMANLLVEIQGAMFEEDETVWNELLTLVFQFVNSDVTLHVDAALNIFNGLFSYIIDHLNKYKQDLLGIFRQTLNHKELDIKIAALKAVSNYLETVEQKDTKKFIELIPDMVQVITASMAADDEVVLKDALVEFNEIAEIEPKFFQSKFPEIFQALRAVVLQQDFTNSQIRQLPIEFFVTIIERIPNIVKKNTELLKELIELIFRLMIDIDEDIPQSWLRPKEGFKDKENDEQDNEDNVDFGKGCIDKIISGVGDTICLPILSMIVNNTMNNDSDWRYKNAALMAFSQVGEYINDIQNISIMVPIVVQHLQHPNPKIRYAALHCIGQISDDMTEEFQETYGEQVLPGLIALLDDPVHRVSAHCCSAITNFMDGASEELVMPNVQVISQKLSLQMKQGISIQKENSVTAFATTVVVIKEKFDQYFPETLDVLLECLNSNPQPEYNQFRAQCIEAITLISSSVSEEVFLPQADKIIQSMIFIQKQQMDENDPQRSYLLSAWQRICLIMKDKFTPYLTDILPSILSQVRLKAEMKIEGQDGSYDIENVLKEVGTSTEGKSDKKLNVMTDEIEEKDSAIQMLIVFIEQLGPGFAQYIDQVSQILLGLTQFYASDNIRISSCGALPSLVKSAKEAQPDHITGLHEMSKMFCNNIIEAMDTETETECLIAQSQAIKEILEEAGNNLLQQDSVDQFSSKIFEFLKQSENRIEDNNKYQKENMDGDEEDKLDEEDIAVLKEENKSENELQIQLAEILGILFKTHQEFSRNLVHKLVTEVLPEVQKINTKQKQKFMLFILDDMVEYLGPDFLGPMYPNIAQQICSFSSSKFSAIRQAAVYGIGMIAQHGGAHFATISQLCLDSLKEAISYPMDAATKEKKSKQTQFNHARDNAIAALGKILKHQEAVIDSNMIADSWLQLLPLQHDLEEAKLCNEYLVELLIKRPQFIMGANNSRVEQIIIIIGSICTKKQSTQDTLDALSVIISDMFGDQVFGQQIKEICENKLNEESRSRLQETYNKCNEEVRQKVAQMWK